LINETLLRKKRSPRMPVRKEGRAARTGKSSNGKKLQLTTRAMAADPQDVTGHLLSGKREKRNVKSLKGHLRPKGSTGDLHVVILTQIRKVK